MSPPTSLLGPEVCVVCSHDGHPDEPCHECESIDDTPFHECGCEGYVTEEDRGQIIVPSIDKRHEFEEEHLICRWCGKSLSQIFQGDPQFRNTCPKRTRSA